MQTQELLKLFTRFCPIWYYTKSEPYLPARFEDILGISNLSIRKQFKRIPENPTDFQNLKDRLINEKLYHNNTTLSPEILSYIINSFTPADVDKMMVNIQKDKRKTIPLGKQIICRTTGVWTTSEPLLKSMHTQYIDLQYITLYAWNGTISEHAFDIEMVTVRLYKTAGGDWDIKRVFGSSHGNGMWTNKYVEGSKTSSGNYLLPNPDLELNGERPVMYSANESHSMYFKPGRYKRMFRFADDVCEKSIRWDPTEFIYIPIDTKAKPIIRVNIDESSRNHINLQSSADTGLDYFKYTGYVGNESNNQVFPASFRFVDTDTNNLDGYYKYEGGVNNIFNGRHAKISQTLYIIIITLISLILVAAAAAMYFIPAKANKWLIALKWILGILSLPAFAVVVISFLFIN